MEGKHRPPSSQGSGGHMCACGRSSRPCRFSVGCPLRDDDSVMPAAGSPCSSPADAPPWPTGRLLQAGRRWCGWGRPRAGGTDRLPARPMAEPGLQVDWGVRRRACMAGPEHGDGERPTGPPPRRTGREAGGQQGPCSPVSEK